MKYEDGLYYRNESPLENDNGYLAELTQETNESDIYLIGTGSGTGHPCRTCRKKRTVQIHRGYGAGSCL